MHPVLIRFTDTLKIHTYGVCVATGFFVAILLAARQAKRECKDPDLVMDMAFWIIIVSLITSRILFIIVNLETYLQNPIDILKFWKGGVVWYGGFIGGLATVIYYTKKRGVKFWPYADILAPSVSIGHAFGRFGCFFAGCCYGKPAHIPWAAQFPLNSMVHSTQVQLGMVAASSPPIPVHPTQLYEAFLEMCIFTFLIFYRRHKKFHGELILWYMILYSIVRSVVELFRGDFERGMIFRIDLFKSIPGPEILSTSQTIAIGIIAAALFIIINMRKREVVND